LDYKIGDILVCKEIFHTSQDISDGRIISKGDEYKVVDLNYVSLNLTNFSTDKNSVLYAGILTLSIDDADNLFKCIKQYRKENNDIIKDRDKKYREENKDNYKKYRENNKEKRNVYSREYSKNNREYFNLKKKEYYSSEKGKETKRKWCNNYNKKNPHIVAWRSLMRRMVVQLQYNKTDSTINELGYSAEDLKNHIGELFLSGMSWSNYGEWHIDHTKSVSLFEKETPPSIVNELSNLKPMWATTREIGGIFYEGNLNKGNKLE
jgi:hypothetical protein